MRQRQCGQHFFNNTVVSTRTGNTTLFRLSTNEEQADCRNNILLVTAAGNRLALLAEAGTLSLTHNWLKPGRVNSHAGAGFTGAIADALGTWLTGCEYRDNGGGVATAHAADASEAPWTRVRLSQPASAVPHGFIRVSVRRE